MSKRTRRNFCGKGTTYFVSADARNDLGTGYGDPVAFTTLIGHGFC